MTNDKKHFDSMAIHVDKQDSHNALVQPIYMTSTFTFDNMQHVDEFFELEREVYIYTRGTNPTLNLFQQQMAKLEGGLGAVAFSSGMGAVAAVLVSLLSQGDEIILHRNVYGCTYVLTDTILRKFGVNALYVDLTDLQQLEKQITTKTKLIFFETPTNPSLDVIDIAKVVEIAQKHDIKVIVDNTFLTPYFQKPLALGADIVLHSATKYLSGHGDLIGGVAIANDQDYLNELNYVYMGKLGSVMSPFNAWLLLRGLKTLGVRMRQHEENAHKVVEFLTKHPKVTKVMYPGLSQQPNHEVAKKQMSGFGAMISFEVEGDKNTAYKIVESVKFIKLAVSLGDAETLIEIPAKMTHRDFPEEEYYKFGFTDKTIRLSVGLENYQDIIEDLKQAIEAS